MLSRKINPSRISIISKNLPKSVYMWFHKLATWAHSIQLDLLPRKLHSMTLFSHNVPMKWKFIHVYVDITIMYISFVLSQHISSSISLKLILRLSFKPHYLLKSLSQIAKKKKTGKFTIRWFRYMDNNIKSEQLNNSNDLLLINNQKIFLCFEFDTNRLKYKRLGSLMPSWITEKQVYPES